MPNMVDYSDARENLRVAVPGHGICGLHRSVGRQQKDRRAAAVGGRRRVERRQRIETGEELAGAVPIVLDFGDFGEARVCSAVRLCGGGARSVILMLWRLRNSTSARSPILSGNRVRARVSATARLSASRNRP